MKSALLLLAVFAAFPILAQQPGVLTDPISTDVVTCTAPPYARQSKTVISPSGLRVHAEVRANKVTPPKGDDRNCSITLLLHIADGNSAPRTLTVTQFTDIEWEFAFDIYGFSRDGHLMLGRLQGTLGDAFEIKTVVFDTQINKSFVVESAAILKPITPAKCYLYATPNGFSSEKPIIQIGAIEEDYLPSTTKPCYQKSFWVLDYEHQRVTRAPKGLKTVNYGTVPETN